MQHFEIGGAGGLVSGQGSGFGAGFARAEADRDRPFRLHDIRNVVSCLRMVADELQASDAPRQAVLGDRVLRACERLLQLGGDNDTQGRKACLSFPDLLGDVVALAGTLAGPRTRIEAVGPDLPVRSVAEMALFRILLNLISNAVRATNGCGGGFVGITADLTACGVSVLISNDGTGLTVARRRADQAATGSGLGLVIAEALADDLGGTLEMGRCLPSRTELRLTLPLSIFARDR